MAPHIRRLLALTLAAVLAPAFAPCQALAADGDEPREPRFDELVHWAASSARDGRLDDAETQLAQARELPTATPGLLHWAQGAIDGARGRIDEAVAEFRAALSERDTYTGEMGPGDDLWLDVARLEAKRGDAAAAFDACRRLYTGWGPPFPINIGAEIAAVAPPAEREYWQRLCDALDFWNRGCDRAMDALRALLPEYGDRAVVHRLLAWRPYDLGHEPGPDEIRDSVVHARRAVELEPECAQGWFVLGHSLEASDAFHEAEAAYRRALQRSGANAWLEEVTWAQLRHLLPKMHRFGEALDVYAAGHRGGTIDSQEMDDETYSALAWAAGRYAEGEAHFALELTKDEASGRGTLADAIFVAGFRAAAGNLDGMGTLIGSELAELEAQPQDKLDEFDIALRELHDQGPPEGLAALLILVISHGTSVPGVNPPGPIETFARILEVAPDLVWPKVWLADALASKDRDQSLALAQRAVEQTDEGTLVGNRAREVLARVLAMPVQ